MLDKKNSAMNLDGVSIDILAAVEKAMTKVKRLGGNIKDPGLERLLRVKMGLETMKFNRRQLFGFRLRPIKQVAIYTKQVRHEHKKMKAKRIRRELIDAGVTPYGLIKSESRYLPKVIHDDEHIEAVIYGQHNSNSAMLVATDERIIYLDIKPMIELFDEVSYEVVSGIEFDIHTFFGTVVLHTPVRNYNFKFVNLRCAEKFARHIEALRLEREVADHQDRHEVKQEAGVKAEEARTYPNELDENMAGYYWLPAEEEERRRIQQGLV